MKTKLYFTIAILFCITAIFICISLGNVYISPKELFSYSQLDDYTKTVLMDLRLPRVIMAFLVGMLLASSGNVVQIIFQNPLADPYIIGIVSSATFGAVVAYLLGLPEYSYGAVAFVCCLISTLFLFRIAKKEIIFIFPPCLLWELLWLPFLQASLLFPFIGLEKIPLKLQFGSWDI